MLVRIDKKNWLGNYSSRVQLFNSESHLNNYLRFMSKHEIESKIIGHEVLESDVEHGRHATHLSI